MIQSWDTNKIPAYITDPTASNIHEVCLWIHIKDKKLLKIMSLFKTCNFFLIDKVRQYLYL